MTKAIFIDAGAFIALANREDRYHDITKKTLEEMTSQKMALVTSNFVLNETYTLIKRKTGTKSAIIFGDGIQSNNDVKIIIVDSKLEKKAWDIFKRYSDQAFSYTDCASFALMREKKIQDAFAFDNDFRIFGFNLLPAP